MVNESNTNKVFLSTKDNPYSPFTNFDEWLLYDTQNGYNSCGTIARIASISEAMTDQEIFDEVERAIDRIIELDPLDIYCKLTN